MTTLLDTTEQMPPIADAGGYVEYEDSTVTNGASEIIAHLRPYRVQVTLQGTSTILFHAWNSDAIEAKSKAAKGSAAKKTDDLNNYVYWKEVQGQKVLALPGANLVAAMIVAAKRIVDPSNPRASGMAIVKSTVLPLDEAAPFEPLLTAWQIEDRRRVVVQRAGVTRTRPALKEGWRCTFNLLVQSSEFIKPKLVLHLIQQAGLYVGLCDYRPTFGRFQVVRFDVLEDDAVQPVQPVVNFGSFGQAGEG